MTQIGLTATQTLARFAANLTVEGVSPSTIGTVKDCLIDHFENVLQAPDDRRVRAAVHSVPKGRHMPCAIWGTAERTDPANAAFINGVLGAIVPRNDIHPASAGHAGSVVIPALLAAAADSDATGADFIAAMLAGYEVIARVGTVLLRPGLSAHFRPTALTAPLGAAVAVARLRRLPAEKIAAAIELATHSAFGLNEWARAGSGEDAFHSGWGARNGYGAALLAEGGALGAPEALEGVSGLFTGYGVSDRAPMLVEGLGKSFEIENVQHKPVGACLMVQAPCQLAEQVLGGRVVDPRSIASIEVTVSDQAKNYPGCDNAGSISTVLESIMSIQFSVAAVVGAGAIKQSLWSDFDNPSTLALLDKVVLRTDARFTANFPFKQGANVLVRFVDGTTLEGTSDDYMSMTSGEIRERFAETAGRTMPKNRSGSLLNSIDTLERMTFAGTLQELLAKPSDSVI